MGAAGVWAWLRPTYNSFPTPHGPITDDQCQLLRTVDGDAPVAPGRNPGARTFASFLASERERQEVLQELQPLKRTYGISLIQAVHGAIYRSAHGRSTLSVHTHGASCSA